MKRSLTLGALALLLSLSVGSFAPEVGAQPAPAKVVKNHPPIGAPNGWKGIFAEDDGKVITVQLIPANEKEESWKKMMMLQVNRDPSALQTTSFLNQAVEGLKGQCEHVESKPVGSAAIPAFQAEAFMVACTKNKQSGLGEVSILMAVQGKDFFYHLQHVWRTESFTMGAVPLTNEEFATAWKLLHGAIVCQLAENGKTSCATLEKIIKR